MKKNHQSVIEAQVDPSDGMTEHRVSNDNAFVISGVIDSYTVYEFDECIRGGTLDMSKPVSVIINSVGGDVASGIYIYEKLRNMFPSVTTYAFGNVYSIATVIFLAAEKEKRYASPAAMFMIHNPWLSTSGNKKQLLKDAERLGKIEDSLVKLYCLRLSLPESEIRGIMNSEGIYSTEEAINLGLVGAVLGFEEEAEARGAFVDGRKRTMAVKVKAQQEDRMEQDANKTDTNATEVARLRGLAALLGHGYDDEVAKAMAENGPEAGELAIRLIATGVHTKPSVDDQPKAAAGEPVGGDNRKQKNNGDSRENWKRPAVHPPQNSGEEAEIDEVKAAFDSNPSIRAAFSTLENFRLFIAKS